MLLMTRGRRRALLVSAALIAAFAGFDATRLWRAGQLNDALRSGTLPAADGPDAPVQLRFARAAAQAASGADEVALNRYRALQEDPEVGAAARYNSANLLLRQAGLLRAGTQPGQAIPLIELAKESYRELLRANPDDWDARYNLERAQRLLPEPEEADTEPPDLARSAERAATTMRGYSPGLP